MIRNINIPTLGKFDNIFFILMASGKLFMIDIINIQRGTAETKEIPLAKLGLDKKVVGMSDTFKYLWTEDGEIYEWKQCCTRYPPCKCIHKHFTLVSDHQLSDGSKIAYVHQIVVRSTQVRVLSAIARVTTTFGDQVVLSKSLDLRENSFGRKPESQETPSDKFHMLDYDFERIRFTQIECN